MSTNMTFDPFRATLVATGDELAELARLAPDELSPTVAGILQVLARPRRSVVIERFDRDLVVPVFVAWDTQGRAVVTEGGTDGRLHHQATHLEPLPALLSQAVRLHPGIPVSSRPALTTSAAAIASAFAGQPDGETGLASVLDGVTQGWRASGAWAGAEVDATVTVMQAGPEGLWALVHQDGPLHPDSRVELRPLSPAQARVRLGDVVTGRRSAPSRPEPVSSTGERR